MGAPAADSWVGSPMMGLWAHHFTSESLFPPVKWERQSFPCRAVEERGGVRGLRAPSSRRQVKPLSSSRPLSPSFCHCWLAGHLPVPLFFCFCPQVPPILGVLPAPPNWRLRFVPTRGSAHPHRSSDLRLAGVRGIGVPGPQNGLPSVSVRELERQGPQASPGREALFSLRGLGGKGKPSEFACCVCLWTCV